MTVSLLAYSTLFASALSAATILPGSSEAVLAVMVSGHPEAVVPLWTVATVGNVLGSAVNWFLGRWTVHFVGRQWFPVTSDQLDQATGWFRRYGMWSLLFAWTPIVGDPLTVAAGMLRTAFVPFIVLVSIGKAARYGVILGGMGVLGWI